MCPPNFICQNQTLNVLFEGGDIGKWLASESRALVNEICVLINEMPENSTPFCYVRTQWKDNYVLDWPKSLYGYFHKIKYFSFSLITLLIWIFWILQLSPAWYNTDCSQLMYQFDHYQFQLDLPDHGAWCSEKSLGWIFTNQFWHVWSVSAPSPYTACIFFFSFQFHFTFLKIIKDNIPKTLCSFFHFQY